MLNFLKSKHFYFGLITALTVVGTFWAVFFMGAEVWAQDDRFGVNYGINAGLGTQDVRITIVNIIRYALGVLGIIALVLIIYAGVVWMTAGGNKEKIDTAKKIIFNAVIGLIIIACAYGIVLYIFRVLSAASNPGPGGPGGGACTPNICTAGCWRCNSGGTGIIPDNGCLPCGTPPVTFRITGFETSYDTPGTVSTNVHLCSSVQARFNSALEAGRAQQAINNNSVRIDGGTANGTWQVFGNTLIFRHNSGSEFSANTSYATYYPRQGNTDALRDGNNIELSTCDLSASCIDSGTSYRWNFSTGSTGDTEAPQVLSTYPTSDPSYAPDRNVNTVPIFQANFSENIDITSIASVDATNPALLHPRAGRVTIERLSGQGGTVAETLDNNNFEIEVNGSAVIFWQTAPATLQELAWYRVTLSQISDLCGLTLATPKVIEFQTNNVRPGIAGWYPTGSNICPDVGVVTVTFNTSMYQNRVSFSLIGGSDSFAAVLNSGQTTVSDSDGTFRILDAGNITTGYRVFEYRPARLLQDNRDYAALVSTNRVIDQSGLFLEQPWTFHVADASACSCTPYIAYVSPNQGNRQECLTIFGQCFTGTTAHPASVSGLSFNTTAATINGSAATYISTTLPAAFSQGDSATPNVTITYNEATYGTATSNNTTQSFYVSSNNVSSGPCLWSLNPNSGCYGNQVGATGLRFRDSVASTPRLVFTNNLPVTVAAGWSDTSLTATVPNGAQTGQVRVRNNNGLSNPINFTLSCGVGANCSSSASSCTPDNSVCATNYCHPTSCLCDNVPVSCDGDVTTAGCQVSTALCTNPAYPVCDPSSCTCVPNPTPQPCDGNTTSPGCQANDGLCAANQICEPASCLCVVTNNQPCDGDVVAAGCQINNSLCTDPTYPICTPSACICTAPPPPLPCDGDVTTAGCQVSTALCTNPAYPVCDPSSCTCVPNPTPQPCDGNTTSPGCQANDGLCAANQICEPASCLCVTTNNQPCDSQPTWPGCQDSDALCTDPSFPNCTPSACICTAPPPPLPCDGDVITAGCQVSTALCTNPANPVCDPSSCTCVASPGPNVVVLSIQPTGTQICRNIVASVLFSELMDQGTLNANNVYIYQGSITNKIATGYGYQQVAFNTEGCTYVNGCTRVVLYPQALFAANTLYTIQIEGGTAGVKSLRGGIQHLDDDYDFTIAANAQICEVSEVEINPSSHVFTAENQMQNFTAIPRAANRICYGGTNDGAVCQNNAVCPGGSCLGQILVSTPSYSWTWSWSQQDPNDIISPSTSNTETQAVTSFNRNGQAQLIATLTETGTGGRSVSGSAQITNFLCRNPWPAPPPYTDNSAPAHFSFKYCRGNEDTPTLPALNNPPSASTPNTAAGILQEYLFLFDSAISQDAIGVRVMSNPENLSISEWYRQKFNKEAPGITKIDGYSALNEGRTVYVLAGNLASGSEASPSAANLYTNIYVMSYNEGASADTRNIFQQLVNNWQFNTNITNPLNKQKLIRDTKRRTDLGEIVSYLRKYKKICSNDQSKSCNLDSDCPAVGSLPAGTCVNHYPQIPAGSYLSGRSTSIWPSWQLTLGKELNHSLPLDPLNSVARHCSIGGASCLLDVDCTGTSNKCLSDCPSGYDPNTCWNEQTKNFTCPDNSHLYGYYSWGLSFFRLYTNLEYWPGAACDPAGCCNYQVTN